MPMAVSADVATGQPHPTLTYDIQNKAQFWIGGLCSRGPGLQPIIV